MGKYFVYGKKEIQHLGKADKNMAQLIKRIGPIQREIQPEPFSALVGNIVSQQISTKAAATIYAKLQGLVKKITPINILKTNLQQLRNVGLSEKKAGYIFGIAEAVEKKQLDFKKMLTKTDEEVMRELVLLKGIGVWSAEMFLIFTLERRNVLSYLDLGIRRGIMRLHNLESLDKPTFEKYEKLYSPYGTVASLYLWELANQ